MSSCGRSTLLHERMAAIVRVRVSCLAFYVYSSFLYRTQKDRDAFQARHPDEPLRCACCELEILTGTRCRRIEFSDPLVVVKPRLRSDSDVLRRCGVFQCDGCYRKQLRVRREVVVFAGDWGQCGRESRDRCFLNGGCPNFILTCPNSAGDKTDFLFFDKYSDACASRLFVNFTPCCHETLHWRMCHVKLYRCVRLEALSAHRFLCLGEKQLLYHT